MEDYKRGSHSVWDCKYHLVWTTKYRYAVLAGDVGQRCRELLREIARSQEMVIYAGSINRDPVHMLIGIPPHISVSRAVQYLKEKSSHKLLSEFAGLRKRSAPVSCHALQPDPVPLAAFCPSGQSCAKDSPLSLQPYIASFPLGWPSCRDAYPRPADSL
jgi:REP element-mobilizing transposase RayT